MSSYIFERMLEKLLLRKYWKVIEKNVFSIISFAKFELSNPPTYGYTDNWLYSKFSFVCSENFQNCWESVRGGITFQ